MLHQTAASMFVHATLFKRKLTFKNGFKEKKINESEIKNDHKIYNKKKSLNSNTTHLKSELS